MSGAEAMAALGVISSCITLVDTSKKLLDAARDQRGLPEAFRMVREELPMMTQTLLKAKSRSKAVGKDDWEAVKPVLERCEQQLQDLERILKDVMTSETDGHLERYKKLVKTSFKGHKVETMAQWIFEQLLKLQSNHVFANVATTSDLKAAIAKLEEIPPSVDDEDGRYVHMGAGSINVANDLAQQTNHNYSGTFTTTGGMHIGPATHNHFPSMYRDEADRERSAHQQILNSLMFDEVTWREERIVESHSETFHWAFDDKVTQFKRWLSSSSTDTDVFWIGGKAGSGKSTLMKFLAEHPKTDEILREWAGSHQLIIIKHFFWNSGTSMQQSQLGLMQNMLYQILLKCPDLAPFASPQRWDAVFSNTTVRGWDRKELTLAIQNIMKQNSLEVNFCFFVDGLDEYTNKDGDDHYRLVQDLDTLARSARVKVCVSSRHWNVFEDRYNTHQTPKIIIQDHTWSDIYNYAKETLENDERFRRLANIEPQVYNLMTQISDRADGVFLWVFLVVKSLLRGLTDHDNTGELQRRLNEMPPDLNAYFRKMFDNIDSVYRAEAMRAFQFLAEAGNLPLMSIHCISKEVFDSRYGLGARTRTMTKAEFDKARDKSRSCVNKWCRDLVDIRESQSDNEYLAEEVFISHKTVCDFLLTQEMREKFLEYPVCQASHLEGLCMTSLALLKIWPPAGMDIAGPDIIRWAKKCEDRELFTPLEILDDLVMTTRTVKMQKNVSAEVPELRARNMLWLAAHQGLTLYVGERLDRDPSCMNVIWDAMLPKYEIEHFPRLKTTASLDIINKLLAKGFDPNDVLRYGTRDDGLHVYNRTAWQKFLGSPRSATYVEAAKLLLLNGADPDIKTMSLDECLHDVRQCLLENYWYHSCDDKPDRERQIDSWVAEARAIKTAKSLEALRDTEDAQDSETPSVTEPRSLTSIIIFLCAVLLAVYADLILYFTPEFMNAFGVRRHPGEA